MTRSVTLSGILILFISIGFTVSCLKQEFDAPPDSSGYDPKLGVTHTISEIQDLPSPAEITEDWVITGIVNMDDREGNAYKKVTIQDHTGGIEILLDQNNLYNDYPVGRKIYVRLKGLFKSDNNGLPQLGYTPDETGSLIHIPYTMIDRHMVKADYPNDIIADTVTLAEIANLDDVRHLLHKLIVVKDAEFSPDVTGLPMADPATIRSATNRDLTECSSPTRVAVRTSGYARFQSEKIPGGNGTLTGVYTIYGPTPQLVIRSMEDLDMTGVRCDGSNPNAEVILNDEFSDLGNWNVVSVTGDQEWEISSAYGNPKPCVTMSGYASGINYENEDWLITQPIDLAGYTSVSFSFQSAEHYEGIPLACYISTDYSGSGNPNDAGWTELPAVYDEAAGFVWTHSGHIDLSAYAGQTIHIAYKVTSTASGSKTWEIDNVKIMGEK